MITRWLGSEVFLYLNTVWKHTFSSCLEKEGLTPFLLYFRPALADNWYSLSYLYFSTLGTLVTVVVGIIISLLTGTSFRAVIECVSGLLQTKMS